MSSLPSQASIEHQKPLPQKQSTLSSYLLSELPINSDNLIFGLNFKYTKVDKKGIISRFKNKKEAIDIDLSCIVLDSTLNVIDTVWFKKLRDDSEAIRHHGDSLNGRDRGDMAEFDRSYDVETISLDLAQIPKSISHVALIVSTYNGYPLNRVERGDIHISDDEGNEVFANDLTLVSADTTAQLIGTLSREMSDWRITLNNLPLNNHKIELITEELIGNVFKTYSQ